MLLLTKFGGSSDLKLLRYSLLFNNQTFNLLTKAHSLYAHIFTSPS